eukprot:XP_001707758.1 Hypothetical protein GL50803_20674 [Giardia lamblia ATCC 50803]
MKRKYPSPHFPQVAAVLSRAVPSSLVHPAAAAWGEPGGRQKPSTGTPRPCTGCRSRWPRPSRTYSVRRSLYGSRLAGRSLRWCSPRTGVSVERLWCSINPDRILLTLYSSGEQALFLGSLVNLDYHQLSSQKAIQYVPSGECRLSDRISTST